MKKTIVCGPSCPDGKLVACPFDEKNLCTDWLEDFLFDGACTTSAYNSKACGYVNFGHEDMLCEVHYKYNVLIYRFPFYNFISESDVNTFMNKLREYLVDCDNLTAKVSAVEDHGYYKPEITVKFYSRYDS